MQWILEMIYDHVHDHLVLKLFLQKYILDCLLLLKELVGSGFYAKEIEYQSLMFL